MRDTVAAMHRIPEDLDTRIFVGADLSQVCFGAHVVGFEFSAAKRLTVTVQGAYIHAGPQTEGWIDEVRLPTQTSRLMQLTNHQVVQATRLDATRLRLDFDHGHSLTLIDDTDQYESFHINTDNSHWII